LHITFHAGCEADLVAVANELGWTLHTIMLLRQPDACNEWYSMTDNVVSMLWTRFQSAIEAADVVIVSDTAPLARLFVNHPVKNLIVWVCNRLNYGCSVPAYAGEVKWLTAQPWVKYVAYTPFEVDFAQRAGFDVKWHGTIRPVGRKTVASPTNHQTEVFVGAYHNDAIAMDLRSMISASVQDAGLSIAEQSRYTGSAELQTFAAVVHVPYAASNLALFEALANNIPYLIPSETLMQAMIDRRVNLPLKDSLFVPDSKASSIEWYRFADCFIPFDRFEDIGTLLQSNTLAACKERMAKRYTCHKEQTLAQWRALINGGDPFAPLAPLLKTALEPFHDNETFVHWFRRLPQSRDVTFGHVIQSLRTLNRPPRILELGTMRSFVGGQFHGCNTSDVSVWEPHVMDRWDWSAGCFTKVMSMVFADAHIVSVDLCSEHLDRCRIMTQDSSCTLEFVHASSVDYLSDCTAKFDLIYLDTGDMTPIEPTAELQLWEAQRVDRVLMPGGLLLLDDVRSVVPMKAGCVHPLGKAFRSLPWLMEHGFYVCMDEYQTLLRRKAT
jgi:hypothetical protein